MSIIFEEDGAESVDLSIIVPMYNTEKYICETLNSLVSSDFQNLEIIVVDDGSEDNSLQIAVNWFQQRKQAGKVLSHKNQGPSTSRNEGIRLARGKYITFFDSDDICVAATYRKMLHVLDRNPIDFVIARGVSFDNNTQAVSGFPDSYVWDSILQGRTIHISTLMQEPRIARLESSSVLRIFKREFLISNQLTFPEKLFFEDAAFHAACMLRARRVALLGETLLFYRVGREGQTTGSFGKKRFNMLRILDIIREDVEQNDVPDSIGANLIGLLVRMVVWCSEFCAYDDRPTFILDAVKRLNAFPKMWIPLYASDYAYDDWERELCAAITSCDYGKLAKIAESVPEDKTDFNKNEDASLIGAILDNKKMHSIFKKANRRIKNITQSLKTRSGN